ncbi:hypothetical protein JCM5353_002312 [Sporobolomyces roseus]
MAQRPHGITVAQAVKLYADEFTRMSAASQIPQECRSSWPSHENILEASKDLGALYADEMKVNLAILVPAGTALVKPLRTSWGGVRKPVKVYISTQPDSQTAIKRDKDLAGQEMLRKDVPGVVAWPRLLEIEPRSRSEPFPPAQSMPFTEHLAAFGRYSRVTLTQLLVEGPPSHPFYAQRYDDRLDGAPFSFDSTYVLLILSNPGDISIPTFRVMFKSSIPLRYGLGNRHTTAPWTPSHHELTRYMTCSRDDHDSNTVKFRPPPLDYSRNPSNVLHHFGTLLFERGLDRASPPGGSSARSLGHRQQKIYGQRQAQGGIPSLFEDA